MIRIKVRGVYCLNVQTFSKRYKLQIADMDRQMAELNEQARQQTVSMASMAASLSALEKHNETGKAQSTNFLTEMEFEENRKRKWVRRVSSFSSSGSDTGQKKSK